MLLIYLLIEIIALTYSVWSASQWNAEPVKFVISFPSIWRATKDFDFHLVLFENPEYKLPVTFVANLSLNGDNIASQTFQQTSYGHQKHTFKNINQAKSNLADESFMSPQVKVVFTNNGLETYDDISGYETQLDEKFVFIQTDKAIYKPSQNVKIRVLAIDRDLRAIASGGVLVTVTDPNENIIEQWTDQMLDKGLFSGNFSLSDFVTLGEWTISVKGDNSPSATKTFSVQQYVLPKYEVKLNFPDKFWVVSPNVSDYKGYVKAKYTFGKSIKGKAAVVLTSTGGCSYEYDNPHAYDWMEVYPVEKKVWPLINITVNLTGDGSAEDGAFTLKGLNEIMFPDNSSLILANERKECPLSFDVNVTEELTGEIMKSSDSVVLYQAPYSIKVHESVQKTIKPSLPFTMRFQVVQPDGSPITKRVEVFVQVYHDTSPPSYYSEDACSKIQSDDSLFESQGLNFTIRTDSDGIVAVTVTPPKDVKATAFQATIPSVPGVKSCESRSTPQSMSYNSVSIYIDRQPSQSKTMPKVGDVIKFLVLVSYKVDYIYFLLSQNGQVLDYRKVDQAATGGDNSTSFSVYVTLPREAAPRVAALAWTMEGSVNEVLADAIEFQVDGLVRQNLTAQFSPGMTKPRGLTSLNLKTAEANATVALLAVDKSVLLLKNGNDITLDDVLGKLGEGAAGIVSPVLYRCGRCGWWPWSTDGNSAESVFSGVGMTIKSNAITATVMGHGIPLPIEEPFMFGGLGRGFPGIPLPEAGDQPLLPVLMSLPPEPPKPDVAQLPTQKEAEPGPPSAPNPPTVRKNFPESWIWEVVQTNSTGGFSKRYEAPDTITTWVLSALAVGDKEGFGALASPAEMTVFQDFFVNLDVSHPTIIRGEQVEIKAVIFNYHSKPVTVNTLLKKSPDFDISPDDGKTFSSRNFNQAIQVPANAGSSIPIWIKPKKLGTINLELSGIGVGLPDSADAMRKEVTVEAEGETRFVNKPMLLRLVGSTTTLMKQTINVDEMFGKTASKDIVEGSKLIQLQAMGDIMGRALTNLGSQIRLPTGCGEQTMLTLAPNVYIYKYLKSAGTLTSDIEQKANSFVDQGYVHELTYQRNDGGFSAFGSSDSASSTWLTAFVLRSFSAAFRYMGTIMSPEVLMKTVGFLKSQAKRDGLFTEPGRIIHSSMKGGAGSDINLAAYIYMTWVESMALDDFKWSSVNATRELIIKTGTSETNTDRYQLALIAYALSILPSDKPVSLRILNRLVTLGTSKNGLLYWELPAAKSDGLFVYEPSGPSQTETAGYALLAMMNHQQTDSAISVARWLMSQRNSLGGFESTQDTVVGLQALAEVAPLLTSTNTNLNISATFIFADNIRENLSANFHIEPKNARVLQSFDPDRQRQALKAVEISVNGTGVGLVQLAIRYNVKNQTVLDSGDYTISVVRDTVARKKREAEQKLTDTDVQLKACTKPITTKGSTGMAVLEVGIPTGFDLDLAATEMANKVDDAFKAPLKRVESGERKVVYYFDTLEDNATGEGACVIGRINRKTAATKVQPPMARVYSYYFPERSNVTEFSFRGMSIGE